MLEEAFHVSPPIKHLSDPRRILSGVGFSLEIVGVRCSVFPDDIRLYFLYSVRMFTHVVFTHNLT